MPVTCYIGIGSNLGDRKHHMHSAIDQMKRAADIKVTRVSSIYETEPMSNIPQGKFLNGVIEIETALSPRELLMELNRVEANLGRKRAVKNSPRTIDLDILYYGGSNVNEDGLVIPHPRILDREFVLRGLRELGVA